LGDAVYNMTEAVTDFPAKIRLMPQALSGCDTQVTLKGKPTSATSD
jgi:hypothetical protein